jgi:TetR/AcrR family transcriptional regulator, lmrAB and yxaGH operons repressor
MAAKGGSTRERLITATMRLIQAQGYSAVGVAAILTEAKATRSSLYHHFPRGKPELAEAAVSRLTQQIIDSFDQARKKQIPADEHLRRLCSDIIDWLNKTDWQEGALLAVLTTVPVPDLSKAMVTAHDSVKTSYCTYLRQAGVANAEDKSQVVLSALDGAVQAARISRNPAPLTACAKVLAPMLRAA